MLWDRLLWDRPGLILAPPAPRSPWVRRRSWEAVFLRLAPRLPAVVCQHRLPLGARQPEALGLTAEPAGGPLLMTQGSPALSGPLEGDGSDGEKPPSCGKRPCGLQVPMDSRVAWWRQSTWAGCVPRCFLLTSVGGMSGRAERPAGAVLPRGLSGDCCTGCLLISCRLECMSPFNKAELLERTGGPPSF